MCPYVRYVHIVHTYQVRRRYNGGTNSQDATTTRTTCHSIPCCPLIALALDSRCACSLQAGQGRDQTSVTVLLTCFVVQQAAVIKGEIFSPGRGRERTCFWLERGNTAAGQRAAGRRLPLFRKLVGFCGTVPGEEKRTLVVLTPSFSLVGSQASAT